MNTLSPLLLHKRAGESALDIINAFNEAKFPLEIEASEGAFTAILMERLYSEVQKTAPPSERRRHPLFVGVVSSETEAVSLAQDLGTLGLKAAVFPWWGILPYRDISPLSAVFGERAAVLSDLVLGLKNSARALIVPQRAFLTPLPPPEYVKKLSIIIRPGNTLDIHALAKTLVTYGYTRVPRVQVHGEFAMRGEVLDILMGADEYAYRILLDFDKVESIKLFDPINQASIKQPEAFVIRPMKEVVWTDELIEALIRNLIKYPEFTIKKQKQKKNSSRNRFLEELISRKASVGEEMYFSMAFEKPASFADYLTDDDTVFFLDKERLENAEEALEREYKGSYFKASRDGQGRRLPAPERLLLKFPNEVSRCRRRVSFMNLKGGGEPGAIRLSALCEAPRSFFGNINYLKEEFSGLSAQGWELIVAAESEAQASRIAELLKDQNVSTGALPLSTGFALPGIKFMLVQENEIFGRKMRPPVSLKTVRSAPIDTFIDLNPGDYVVHVHYGIGHFKGIERVKALGNERDYIKLEYREEEIVFVPIEQVNMVQRYIGNEGAPPRLDRLGSKSWENRKARVSKSVADIAEKLLLLYSKRKQAQGYAFPKDTEWQTMFEAGFPFEETEDQLRCVEEIKADMESSSPMDRLICGDVGYGKTEVALRACFKAIIGGRQAAFLAPTTILAEQHYENFLERFAQFPVRIAMLSRFVGPRQIKKILGRLKIGEVDLLVGTHRIIQKDVEFKNLGLMVIDEEQRFGVKDKEKLKEIKNNLDCLSLSATPIPRTLHMSLLKIRDMSVLATPPMNRHPIETTIEEWNEDKVAAAIRRETERGGQIFYLHNRIGDLREIRLSLERLVPELLIETAHGQMGGQELEDVMHRFVHGGFHILVSTTIIENGIDIPNVNTIIIDHAGMYGVSQLYQLRGRVGRSDKVAYAHLFYSKGKALSEIAMKRLQVISDYTELGSGFKIAMKDMEIRGAGNILGREQSGAIYSVGFDLYLKLLDRAIRRLEDINYEAETEPLLELEYSGFIPDAYIDAPQEKMEIYKKIASVRTAEDHGQVYAEMLDRFGPPPDEAASLLALAEVRIICRELSVASLKEKGGVIRVEFSRVAKISANRLVRLITESGGKVKLDPKQPNAVIFAVGSIGLKEKSEFIREKLEILSA
ncbi:MAG: transcription-repair coupling factor [Treponema sp.]|jgi:transcription-repair coupling factor (superfamily II helicase)|nr:transcription-repair coupling factor [Treponema sp.]